MRGWQIHETTRVLTICLFWTTGVSKDEIRDKKCCSTPTQLQYVHAHTLLEIICISFGHIVVSFIQAHYTIPLSSLHALTVEDLDSDRLFLLDGLCVREAGVADVVIPWILFKYIREVKVSVQGLWDSAALRQPLEIWKVKQIVNTVDKELIYSSCCFLYNKVRITFSTD